MYMPMYGSGYRIYLYCTTLFPPRFHVKSAGMRLTPQNPW